MACPLKCVLYLNHFQFICFLEKPVSTVHLRIPAFQVLQNPLFINCHCDPPPDTLLQFCSTENRAPGSIGLGTKSFIPAALVSVLVRHSNIHKDSLTIQFEESELDKNIQTFFSTRKAAVMDLCQSFAPLFSHFLWYGMKNAGPEQLDELEYLCSQQKILRPHIIVQRIHLIYRSLKNDLLLRLIWQTFLFCQAPFLAYRKA